MILFSPVYSSELVGCRKIGEINNNINNQPLYSTGLYMCLELPDKNLRKNNINNNLIFTETKKINLLSLDESLHFIKFKL